MPIYLVEKSGITGAWIIRGVIGTKTYFGYTKKQAERLYKKAVKAERIDQNA